MPPRFVRDLKPGDVIYVIKQKGDIQEDDTTPVYQKAAIVTSVEITKNGMIKLCWTDANGNGVFTYIYPQTFRMMVNLDNEG